MLGNESTKLGVRGRFALRSMTGYGRAVGTTVLGAVTVEIRSVNHRYLDVALRLPRDVSFLEEEIKGQIKEYVSRGRVDLAMRVQAESAKESGTQLDMEQMRRYMELLNCAKRELDLSCEVKFEHLLSLPGVLVEPQVEADEQEAGQQVLAIVSEALRALVHSRDNEGARLKEDITRRLSAIALSVQQISDMAAQIVESYRRRLRDNVQRLLPDVTVDPGRLEVEIALFADRSNIDEELVRLESHLKNFASFLGSKEAIGRKMDFYLQELNREINTVGSKAPEVGVSQRVVDIKAELEKIREQVQNLE